MKAGSVPGVAGAARARAAREGAAMLSVANGTRRIGPATGRVGLTDAPPSPGGGGDPSALVVDFAQRTIAGAVHALNEDVVCCWPSHRDILVAVADGVGGHEDGAVASAPALASL